MPRVWATIRGADTATAQLEGAAADLDEEILFAVGTPVEYAVWQEIGTTFHPPQPYMRPAVNKAKRRVRTTVAKHDDFDDAMEELSEIVLDTAKDEAPVRTGRLKRSIEMERRD